jgi:DNA-damage-inducible protein J
MTKTTNLSIRLDRELKDQADAVFSAMGMSLTTAITVFVRQAVRQKKIPFEISLVEDRDKATTMQDALIATERIWQSAAQNGTNQMTMEEIDEEIAASRAKRRSQKGNT